MATTARRDRHVAVIGGGIAGLATAHALVTSALAARVTVYEAEERLGGKICTSAFAGAPVDEGADAFLARVPWAADLSRRVGIGNALVSPRTGRAAIWWDELHPIPDGLLLGLPTDIGSLARSALLTWPGKLRAATEPLRPRTDITDDALGSFVRGRFGDEVHVRLLDPLVGSIYAADTDHFSLAAVPQIAELAGRSRSVLLAARHRPAAATGPVFLAPSGGMGQLIAAVAADVEAHGGTICTNRGVTRLEIDGTRWRVDDAVHDAVVLACPAGATARLVPDVASELHAVPAADVALVTLAIDAARWPSRLAGLSGYLVPKPRQRLVTAVSFGSQKWPHWAAGDEVVLRISLGRDGLAVLHLTDEQLVDAAVDEVGRHLGIDLQPTEVRVSRWPGAFPQYRPHHAARVAVVEVRLPEGLALAGASYHGIGIPACVRSGTEAATRTLARLDALPE